MRRDLRQIGLVGLVLWSLIQAWFGHDLLHGARASHEGHNHHHKHGGHYSAHKHLDDGRAVHGHQTLGEANHTKAVHQPAPDLLVHLVPVALLLSFCDFALPQPLELREPVEFETARLIEPQFLERPPSLRAPPIRPVSA